ncbi:aspartate kinase [Candidatus Weimeria sp. HCP3S3_B5]|uniref:aspartate kinase n=1 Tax=Candidatus Weimeria sp. HCP3S3_B5 TaxID=3438871 RepID=UPI002A96EED2|nr:aspartate kinase [Lachnospiraceae bacterium]MDY6352307.1 aspartate kinase [Lachnospiraceae bacterium]
MLIVKKFGGTSVANKERIFNVASRCIEDYKKGNKVVVVLSAMGDTTDDLIAMAKDINPDPPKREMDALLSTGEQVSVALMAMAMASLGVPAVSLNAFQVAMHTTHHHMNSRFKKVDTDRINAELDQGKVVIVTGFQGVNRYDDVTTLGRGGSDTTAVALAAVLGADACEIYTDVDGVYTADPRIVPNAKKLKEVSYDEMLELATLGAQVLHNRSVEMAKKYNVPLVVRSSLTKAEGTVVKEVTKVESMLVSGVAVDKDADRIALIGLKNEPGIAFKVFDLLAKKNINVDMILQSIGREDTKDISFTVDDSQAKEAVDLLKENQDRLTFQKLVEEENVAKLSIVGAGMQSNAGVAAKMFEALYDVGVNIRMISTSEIRITVLIDIDDVKVAMRAVHDKFIDDDNN